MADNERRGSCIPKARGFTLIELMVTIAVLVIIMSIAFPSFVALIRSNRLVSHSNELVASIQLARSEAIRRNSRVAVCGSSDGHTCDAASIHWAQWLVVVPSNSEVLRTNRVKNGVDVMPSTTIVGNGNRVVFSADGLARDATGGLLSASIAVCLPVTRPAQNRRSVHIENGSRVQTLSEDTAGLCEAPVDA